MADHRGRRKGQWAVGEVHVCALRELFVMQRRPCPTSDARARSQQGQHEHKNCPAHQVIMSHATAWSKTGLALAVIRRLY